MSHSAKDEKIIYLGIHLLFGSFISFNNRAFEKWICPMQRVLLFPTTTTKLPSCDTHHILSPIAYQGSTHLYTVPQLKCWAWLLPNSPSEILKSVHMYGARGSVVGWGTMLQAGGSRIQFSLKVTGFFNWPNLSSRTMALGSTQPLNRNEYRRHLWADSRKCARLDVSQSYAPPRPDLYTHM
jgi:hypothetical protein